MPGCVRPPFGPGTIRLGLEPSRQSLGSAKSRLVSCARTAYGCARPTLASLLTLRGLVRWPLSEAMSRPSFCRGAIRAGRPAAIRSPGRSFGWGSRPTWPPRFRRARTSPAPMLASVSVSRPRGGPSDRLGPKHRRPLHSAEPPFGAGSVVRSSERSRLQTRGRPRATSPHLQTAPRAPSSWQKTSRPLAMPLGALAPPRARCIRRRRAARGLRSMPRRGWGRLERGALRLRGVGSEEAAPGMSVWGSSLLGHERGCVGIRSRFGSRLGVGSPREPSIFRGSFASLLSDHRQVGHAVSSAVPSALMRLPPPPGGRDPG